MLFQNTRQSLNSPIVKNEKGSALPYLLAWLLGVPGSILLLIFMLRAVF